MASFKVGNASSDLQQLTYQYSSEQESQVTRPHSSHRLSMTSTPPSNIPTRNSTSRHHSHSVSLGTVNLTHRVTRRKSMNASAANSAAAIAAALQDDGHKTSNRRSYNLKSAGSRGLESNRDTSSSGDRWPLGSGYGNEEHARGQAMHDDSAVADDFLPTEHVSNSSKTKARRASEGSYLTKGDGKRSSGELRCEKCGKGYKHSSCLTKHLWEHTPEWSFTSKLLISKHQQVQLLEAASVLVGMNQDAQTIPDRAKTTESDTSSASPAASGSSDVRDEEFLSSAETTPPPMSDHYGVSGGIDTGRRNRYSGSSSSYSRSYQSAPSSSFPASSSFGQYQSKRRPSTSGIAATADDDDAGLAVAVASLCSFGTPRNGPVLLPADVPPVPPLPAQYAEQNANRLSGHIGTALDYGFLPHSYQRLSDQRDIDMDDGAGFEREDAYDSDEKSFHGGRHDDDDDGVFGNMEGVSHEHTSQANA